LNHPFPFIIINKREYSNNYNFREQNEEEEEEGGEQHQQIQKEDDRERF